MSGRVACTSICPSMFSSPTTFFAQAVVVTKGLQRRERVKARLEHALGIEFPSVVGRVYPLELGPPVGWPLQYRVSGPEPDQVHAIAFKVAQEIASIPGAENINYNWMEPARTIRIGVDQDLPAARAGSDGMAAQHSSRRALAVLRHVQKHARRPDKSRSGRRGVSGAADRRQLSCCIRDINVRRHRPADRCAAS